MGIADPFQKGRVVYRTGDDNLRRIFVVLRGLVVLRRFFCGKEVSFQILGREGVFGLEAFCGPYTTEARCLTDTELMSWSTDSLGYLTVRSGFLPAVVGEMLKIQNSLYANIERTHTMDIKERVKAFLVELALYHGKDNGDESFSVPHIAHKEIAFFLGTTREAVTSAMRVLCREGLIFYEKRKVEVSQLLVDEIYSAGIVKRPD